MYDAGMLPRILRMTMLVLCLPMAGVTGQGQQAALRYQHGDSMQWAAAGLDDSTWNAATDGRIPFPTIQSNGFVWMRTRVVAPAGVDGPLALRIHGANGSADVQEVFVNGVRVAQVGEFPPHVRVRIMPRDLVIELPAKSVRAGEAVDIAVRGWAMSSRRGRLAAVPAFSLDKADAQRAFAGEARAERLLSYVPQLAIGLLLVALGVGVLTLGVWSSRRELFLCALWLVTLPLFLWFVNMGTLLEGADWQMYNVLLLVLNAVGMCVVVELVWEVQGFRQKLFLWVAHACWVLMNVSTVVATLTLNAPTVSTLAYKISDSALTAFNVITMAATVWALLGYGRNRAIAAAMGLINIGYFLRIAGVRWRLEWLQTDFFGAAFYLTSVFIAGLLIHQTWKEWQRSDDLRIEIAAARELQQELVPLRLPAVNGLRMEAAYLPAKDVGGDFYQVLEQRDGSTLVLMGDVSGKGLKAAMTGVLTIGAARAIALDANGPAELLTRLNREVAQGQSSGFVTCACARIEAGGKVTLANAGHLAPYRNGREIAVEAGLPLGIVADTVYTETRVELHAGDVLTLMSDGVVEAQNAAGELFGFARTEEIASGSAETIAQAALAFGQSDDITVLRLEFAASVSLRG